MLVACVVIFSQLRQLNCLRTVLLLLFGLQQKFTLLYFKMAVIPLVPETKMMDVGKLISLGNLLARKVT